MTEQIPLPLEYRSGASGSKFFISDANRNAVDQLDMWEEWPDRAAILVGPEASGKSHLARMIAARAGDRMVIVEDADRDRDERTLFHLHNRARHGGPVLLMTAREPPAHWPVGLPDLGSRLRALPLLRIEQPDDALMPELLAKALRDRGLAVGPDVLTYVARRLERRYAAIQEAAAALDTAALATGRNLSVSLAGKILFDREN